MKNIIVIYTLACILLGSTPGLVFAEPNLPSTIAVPNIVASRLPLSICVLINNTQSKFSEKDLIQATRLVAGLLRTGDSLCVIASSKTAKTLLNLSEIGYQEDVLLNLGQMKIPRGGNLFAAISRAASVFERQISRKRLRHILILSSATSESDNNQDSVSLVKRLRLDGIRVSTLELSDLSETSLLFSLARAGIGEYRFAEKTSDLFSEIEETLESIKDPRPVAAIISRGDKSYEYLRSNKRNVFVYTGRLNQWDFSLPRYREAKTANTFEAHLVSPMLEISKMPQHLNKFINRDMQTSAEQHYAQRYFQSALLEVYRNARHNEFAKSIKLVAALIDRIELKNRVRSPQDVPLLSKLYELKSLLGMQNRRLAKKTLLKLSLLPTEVGGSTSGL